MFVNDGIIAGANEDNINKFLNQLKNRFCLRELPVTSFVGLNLNTTPDYIEIDQHDYVNQLITKYRLETAKPIKTPMETKLDLDQVNALNGELCVKKYQQLLGSLNYIMERSRPDINYSINLLSRYQLKATREMYRYLIRILRYLNSSKYKMKYIVNESAPTIEAYYDASWGPIPDRKSVTGYVILVHGNIVHFKTQKQSVMVLSTAEAEFIALADCLRDVMWIKNILTEMKTPVEKIVIYGDNQASIQIAKSNGN